MSLTLKKRVVALERSLRRPSKQPPDSMTTAELCALIGFSITASEITGITEIEPCKPGYWRRSDVQKIVVGLAGYVLRLMHDVHGSKAVVEFDGRPAEIEVLVASGEELAEIVKKAEVLSLDEFRARHSTKH